MEYTRKNQGTCSIQTTVELNKRPYHSAHRGSWRLQRQPEGHQPAAGRHEGGRCHCPYGRYYLRTPVPLPARIRSRRHYRKRSTRCSNSVVLIARGGRHVCDGLFSVPVGYRTAFCARNAAFGGNFLPRIPHPLKRRSQFWEAPPPMRWRISWDCFCSSMELKQNSTSQSMLSTGRMAMFGTPELDAFHPDIIYIPYKPGANITDFPTTQSSRGRD